MENTHTLFDSSHTDLRRMIDGVGKTIVEAVLTTEQDLVAQGREAELVQLAVMMGALNAVGGYAVGRAFPGADSPAVAEHVQAGLQQALATLLQAAQSEAAKASDEWPTGRMGTA